MCSDPMEAARYATWALRRLAVSGPSFKVLETAEQAVVSKSSHIAEEVVVGKTGSDHTETINHTETIKDTVRRQPLLPSTGPPSKCACISPSSICTAGPSGCFPWLAPSSPPQRSRSSCLYQPPSTQFKSNVRKIATLSWSVCLPRHGIQPQRDESPSRQTIYAASDAHGISIRCAGRSGITRQVERLFGL